MNKSARPVAGATLGAEVLVAAMSQPKIPAMAGEGTAASTLVVTAAISSPKIPPMQGDGVASVRPPRPVAALCTAVEVAARIHFKTPWWYQD